MLCGEIKPSAQAPISTQNRVTESPTRRVRARAILRESP